MYLRMLTAAALLVLMALPQRGLSQDAGTPIVIGEALTIPSEVLGEERRLLVYRPPSYDQTDQRYPVLYLLDGDAHFHHTTGLIQFLTANGHIPEMLVVALPNTQRTRDLTPKAASEDTQAQFPMSGGADTFLAFLGDELMPYIDATYRTAPYQILTGHSFGGLFAVHALFTRPDVFDAYIAISPSLWWDDQALVHQAEAFFTDHPDLKGFLYMTMGNEGGNMLGGAWKLSALMEEHAPEGFGWDFALMEEETHGSVPHRSTYRGLEALYDGWRIPNFAQMAGEGGLDAFDAHYATLSERYGYDIHTPEALINRLGYWHLGQEQHEEALAAFSTNVERYPASANVYDSLGDAYDADGQFEKAKESYERAVEIATAASHANLQAYQTNLERINEKLKAQ